MVKEKFHEYYFLEEDYNFLVFLLSEKSYVFSEGIPSNFLEDIFVSNETAYVLYYLKDKVVCFDTINQTFEEL